MFTNNFDSACVLEMGLFEFNLMTLIIIRGGSRTAATSKMELFVIIVNGFQPLTIIKKCSIFDVPVVLDPPLIIRKRDEKFQPMIVSCRSYKHLHNLSKVNLANNADSFQRFCDVGFETLNKHATFKKRHG